MTAKTLRKSGNVATSTGKRAAKETQLSAKQSKTTKQSETTKRVAKAVSKEAMLPVQEKLQIALSSLKKLSTKKDFDNLGRFGIDAPKAFGVSMSNIQVVAKRLGPDHELAAALWETGWYEARMLTSFVDRPEQVTPAQMDRWCRDFDNWAICDTLCFKLFDRTPYAWAKIDQWSGKREEFVKRAAFALIASLSTHDKVSGDEPFLRCLPLIERAATDERNFVKKGVSWALRGVGRRSAALNAASVKLCRRLIDSSEPAAKWIGRVALKELTSPLVMRGLAARKSKDKR